MKTVTTTSGMPAEFVSLRVIAGRPTVDSTPEAAKLNAAWVASELSRKEKAPLLRRRPAWLVPSLIVAVGLALAWWAR